MRNLKVCLDSRLIKSGEYFVPVVGDNFDGHIFVDEVMGKGAAGVIDVDELFIIAKEKLDRVNPVIVGVAGSVGKSTFRKFLVNALEVKYKVLEGDLNTKLGLSTLIVNELTDQDIMVAELGIDRLGEMEKVMKFINPEFCIITKIEKEHLQYLISLDNVTRENAGAILLSKSGKGYVNKKDFDRLEKWIDRISMTIFTNVEMGKKLTGMVEDLGMAEHEKEYLSGVYRVVKDKFGYSENDFINCLKKIKKPKGRLNILQGKNNSILVDDSYNAVSDASIIAGVEFALNLAKNKNRKLTVVLSPMRETGETEDIQHRNVANYLNKLNDVRLLIVGDDRKLYSKYLTVRHADFKGSDVVEIDVGDGDVIYIKGAQFYRMEKVVRSLMLEPEKASDLLVRQDERWK